MLAWGATATTCTKLTTVACTGTVLTGVDKPATGATCSCGSSNAQITDANWAMLAWGATATTCTKLTTVACTGNVLLGTAKPATGATCSCGSDNQQVTDAKWGFLKTDTSCDLNTGNAKSACTVVDGSGATCSCGSSNAQITD